MRLLTIINKTPSLAVVVAGFMSGITSVGYIMLLLFLGVYIFAIGGSVGRGKLSDGMVGRGVGVKEV